jgi:HD-like signal output (HDOD) protein
MNAIEYVDKVKRLFAVPSTALQVKKLIDNDIADANSIANVIYTDPGLAAHLLKVANSAIYRFPRKVETIQKAVQVIGTSAVYDYALVFGISNAFVKVQDSLIDLDKFWEQSVTCGILCRHFASLFGSKDVDRMFTSGLLHNIGELVVLQVSPYIAKDCMLFDKTTLPKACQNQVLGFTFSEVSAALCERWSLPQSLVRVIEKQHHDGNFSDVLDNQIIQLAYELSVINTFSEHYSIKTHLHSFLFEGLHLKLSDVDEALDIANFQVEQILHLFNPDVFKAA